MDKGENMPIDDQKGIYEPIAESIPDKIQTRAWEVRIDNPRDGDPTILFRTEKVIIDANDNTIFLKDRQKVPDISRKFSKVATDMITMTDPVSQQTYTISAAGVAKAIAIFFEKYWAENNSK
jgi:hypothetical protein